MPSPQLQSPAENAPQYVEVSEQPAQVGIKSSNAQPAGTVRISLYFTSKQAFDLMRAAFLADYQGGGDAVALGEWIGEALQRHAQRTPQQRLEIHAKQQAPTGEKGQALVRTFNVAIEHEAAAAQARADDEQLGLFTSASAWRLEAIEVAIEQARSRGPLPNVPERLPKRLSRMNRNL